jgi:diguanylate cyclase (GGDEF)-like protein
MSLLSTAVEQHTLQLIRYEALFKLIDDVQAFDDLEQIARRVATQWKYFSNVAAWRMVVPDGDAFHVIDGVRGEARISNVAVLSNWDQRHMALGRPTLESISDPLATQGLPDHLTGNGIVDVMVLPFHREGRCIGLLSVAARNEPFSELDKKFNRIFGKHLADRIAGIVLRRQVTNLLVEKATHDALTGLLNRGTIVDWLNGKRALAKRTAEPLSVILIDIDFFKQVNDNFGHPAGDAVLCQVAKRLQEQTRDGDSLGRYGGEEFLVVLSPCSLEEAAMAAERFRVAIAHEPFALPGPVRRDINMTISLGLACSVGNPRDMSLEAMLKQADDALYISKTSGRNRTTAAPTPTNAGA